ncbi:MAG: cytochrome c [Acidobacteriota bacterium]|nr:cytochrome c [Acidobacteriota bacterium]
MTELAPAMALTLLVVVAGGCSPSRQDSVAAVGGEALYERYCGVCHSPDGNGQGPASYLLFPKPRNFVHGQFKLRSTPMGTLATDDDLVRTVSNGIPGTAMFAFAEVLSETEVRSVADLSEGALAGVRERRTDHCGSTTRHPYGTSYDT